MIKLNSLKKSCIEKKPYENTNILIATPVQNQRTYLWIVLLLLLIGSVLFFHCDDRCFYS